MGSSYEFLTFNDVGDMRGPNAKKKIRKHAMKAIGSSRRKPRQPRIVTLEFRPPITPDTSSSDSSSVPGVDDSPVLDDRALYSPCVRALACQPDPFNTAPIHIDGTTRSLLQYFIEYSSIPNNFTFSPKIHCTVESAFRDELLINCILSAAASRMHYSGQSSPPFKSKEMVATQQSLKLLRQRLHEPAKYPLDWTERLVNCILYLGAGAIYRKDLYTAKIHIASAINVAESPPIGGVTRLRDAQVLVRAIALDDLLACLELRPGRLKPHYDPGPRLHAGILPPTRRSDRSQFAAAGFLSKESSVIPPLLKTLVLQVLECYEGQCDFRKFAPRPPYAPQAVAVRHWIMLRTLAARNRLLSFNTEDSKTNALKIALIIWTLLPPSDPRQIKTAQILTRRLRDALGPGKDWDDREDVRLWCLMVGYFAAQEPSDIRTNFAKDVCQLIKLHGEKLSIKRSPDMFDELVAFQRRFLYREPALTPHTEKLAKYVVRRNGWSSS